MIDYDLLKNGGVDTAEGAERSENYFAPLFRKLCAAVFVVVGQLQACKIPFRASVSSKCMYHSNMYMLLFFFFCMVLCSELPTTGCTIRFLVSLFMLFLIEMHLYVCVF